MPYGCSNGDGIIQTSACVLSYASGPTVVSDLGSLVSYQALPDNSLGVRVVLQQGDTVPNRGCSGAATTTIDLICDPQTLYGSMQMADDFDACNPSFVWSYQTACPVCSAADYHFIYTECSTNNTRTKQYQWNEPINCHGGVSLPASQTVACTANTYICDVGYVLNPTGDGCVLCGSAGYSLGGGVLVTTWRSLPDGFRTECTSTPCTKWNSNGDWTAYVSGHGTSSLVAVQTYRRAGAVVFNYKLFSTGASSAAFYVDGQLSWSQPAGTNVLRATQVSISVPLGTHEFKWTFYGGQDQDVSGSDMIEITQLYLENLDYHADTCSPCPAGYRPSILGVDSDIGCTPCAVNTYAPTAGYSQCLACPTGLYQAVEGQYYCDNLNGCTQNDYKVTYSACVSGHRTMSYVLADPVLCTTDASYQPFVPPSPVSVACAACPPHSYRNSAGVCVGCTSGQYYDTTQQTCVANTAGGTVLHTANYFYDGYPTSSLSQEFQTGCDGECYTPAGWRIMADYIDSGRGTATIYMNLDSYLIFSPTLEIDGQISFNFTLSTTDTTSAGVDFLVDGLPYSLNADPEDLTLVSGYAVIPLSKGAHQLQWNIHQVDGQAQFTMSSLAVVGSSLSGAASQRVECAAGTFSTDPSASACTPCPAGTFASGTGAVACTSCPAGTYSAYAGAEICTPCEHGSVASNPGAQSCTPSCQFNIGSDSYSLQGLQSVTVYDVLHQKYDINVCNLASNCINSHVCVTGSSNTATGAGSSFRLAENTDSTSYSTSPFSVYLEHGAVTASCPNGTSTLVNFQCNPYSTDSVPVFVTENACTAIFNWQTYAACHTCVDSDYSTLVGSCVGGRRFVSKTVTNGCNGPTTLPISNQSCSAREIPTGAIVAIVILVVALVFVIGFFIYKTRNLSVKYHKLLEGGVGSGASELHENVQSGNSAVLN